MGSLLIPPTPAGRPDASAAGSTLACRGCGAPLDPGAKAGLAAQTPSRRILLDCICQACGKRALYEAPLVPLPEG